jgi:hypothetical protein
MISVAGTSAPIDAHAKNRERKGKVRDVAEVSKKSSE